MKPISRVIIVAILIGAALIARTVLVPRGGQGPHAAQEAHATYYCPMHPTYTADKPGTCPICSMTLVKRDATPVKVAPAGEKKILYWTDAMIPGYKSDHPGKSPMGMELTPVYEEGASSTSGAATPTGYAAVLVTPQQQQLIGVKVTLVQKRTVTKTLRTVGKIAYDPELYQAQAEYLQALHTVKSAPTGATPEITARTQQVVDAARLRLRLLGLTEPAIEALATAEGPDQRLLLADPQGRVWVYAPVYEFELPLVKVGQILTVEAQALPGRTLEGRIDSIDPVVDATTRAARVRAVVTDPAQALKPGMFVNAWIAVDLGERLMVPETAVMATGTRTLLFVDRGEGRFEPREVTLGVKADGAVEVTAGVTEGERVVTSGNFLIDSESRLKGALEGMSQGEHHHGQ